MAKVENEILADLFEQLRFAPRRQKISQLAEAEKLLKVIDEKMEYPFEFVVFRITGYRPREDLTGKVITGEQLGHDLRVFITNLSRKLDIYADEQEQIVYTVEQLAEKFNVSTKTIGRWKSRGLVGRMLIFPDGKKRIGFLQSTVDDFIKKNRDLTEQAGVFTRLSEEEKEKIITRATELVRDQKKINRRKIINELAVELGRAAETIRYTLIEHDKRNPTNKVFKKSRGIIVPKDINTIYQMHSQGATIPELMDKFNRSRSSIYRILNQRMAKYLLSLKIEFIDSPEFLEPDADKKILSGSLEELFDTIRNSGSTLLNREQETELFRRYNYLKYLACLMRTKINKTRPSSDRLKNIEEYLDNAERIKKFIIENNLGLVISIAGKHIAGSTTIQDLVSEGNFSLMHAVEKFDYTRGYRFSTYASWAIAKDFARKIPAESGRPDRYTAVDMSNIQQDLRIPEMIDFEAVERVHSNLIKVIKDNLDERERYIIMNHYPLDPGVIKKKPKTLKEIGEALGVSKERVRQIELVALQKLRHSLSDEQFDLLTG